MSVTGQEGGTESVTTFHSPDARCCPGIPELEGTRRGGSNNLVVRRDGNSSDVLSVTGKFNGMSFSGFRGSSIGKLRFASWSRDRV